MRQASTGRTTAALLAAALLSACHSLPAAPSAGTSPVNGTATSTVSGRTIDALTGAPMAAVTLSLDEGPSVTTDADGTFQLTAAETGLCRVTASGGGVIPRETGMRMPGADMTVSLIPARFDLATLDQMVRDGGSLRRWTAPPALVVIDAVLQFTSVSDATFVALDERLSADDLASLAADLAWGLPQVTGSTFGAFSSVTTESPAPGTEVNFFSREGRIVVARFRGLSQAAGYWGYGRSARRGSQVVAGAILVDRDFDTAGGPYRRSLRVHEMGHALGYCHVTRRPSFMNSSAVYEPNDFDRDVTRIAFQRAPGNQAPDRDPLGSALGVASSSGMAWGTITPLICLPRPRASAGPHSAVRTATARRNPAARRLDIPHFGRMDGAVVAGAVGRQHPRRGSTDPAPRCPCRNCRRSPRPGAPRRPSSSTGPTNPASRWPSLD